MLNIKTTWTNFNKIEKYKNNFYGAGFVFQRNLKLIGLDLDKCIKDGVLTEQAEKIVEYFKSYTEVSQSGNGLHIIIKVDKEFKLKNSENGFTEKFKMGDSSLDFKELEIIASNKYLLLTGNIYGYEELKDRTEAFNEFYRVMREQKEKTILPQLFKSGKGSGKLNYKSEEIIGKILKSKSSNKFKKIFYEGNGDKDHSSSDLALCNMIAFYTNDFNVIDDIFMQSKLYREKWDRADYKAWTINKALEGTVNKYQGGQRTLNGNIEKIAEVKEDNLTEEAKELREENKITNLLDFKNTDYGNAERFVSINKNIKYCNQWSKWIIWNNKAWEKDETQGIIRLAKQTIRDFEKQIAETENPYIDKSLFRKFINKSESSASLNNMIKLAESELEVVSVAEDFDNEESTKYLLNLKNGILDLRTGILKEHKKSELITKYIDIDYKKNAKKETWIKFLEGIFLGNQELINYIQKAIGYSLSGDTSEQCLFILYGIGSNGKSTFLETINNILFDYAKPIPSTSITISKQDKIPEELARLQGIRFSTSSEGRESGMLDESLIKQMTGGEKITARFLYGNSFDFKPQFHIWFATNHKPRINGTDDGIWRRIKMIPFGETPR